MPRDAPPDLAVTPPRHQRAEGGVALRFAVTEGGRTALRHLDQRAPLRALFPRPEPGEPPLAVLLNCAGGLAGGDALDQAVRIEAGAGATCCTAAAEKVYRSLGPATRVATRLSLGAGAVLEWLPQETILFDGAHLTRRLTAEMAPGARLLAAEILVFGRAAHGERLRQGAVLDRWRLHGEGGALLWADALELSGDIAARLDAPFGFAGAEALGTLLLAAPGAALEAELALLRDLDPPASEGPLGGTTMPRPGLLLARWLGRAGPVRQAVGAAIGVLRQAALGLPPRLPRLWTM